MAKFVPPGYQSTRRILWHSGDGVPDVDVGNANDFYVDDLTGDLYKKEADGSAWNVVGSLAGGAGAGEGFVVLRGSGAPVNGLAGTGVGEADTGSRYVDEDTNTIYEQLGEIDNVNWLLVLAP
jgi:hypothetical protein